MTPSIALIETYVWFRAGEIPLDLAVQLTPEKLHKLWHRTTNWRALLRILLVTRLPLARFAVIEAVARALEREPRTTAKHEAQASLAMLRTMASERAVGIEIRQGEVIAARDSANSHASFDTRFRKLTNSGIVWHALFEALGSLIENESAALFEYPKYAADSAMGAAEKAGVTGAELLHWLRPLGPPTLDEIVAATFAQA